MYLVQNYYPFLYNLLVPLITIPTVDYTLCILFTRKSRWFQLHSVTNIIIVCIIYNDIIDLFHKPITNIRAVSSHLDCYFIIILHIYHLFIVKELTILDYIHHVIFIGFGVIPCIIVINNNITKIGFFATCGLPGAIEYFGLCLVKHNKMDSLTQKRAMAIIYNYIRCPLCIFCISTTYIGYMETDHIDESLFLVLYITFIVYLNGTFYNKLTIENWAKHYYNNKYRNNKII